MARLLKDDYHQIAYYFDAFLWALCELKLICDNTYVKTGQYRFDMTDKYVNLKKWKVKDLRRK